MAQDSERVETTIYDGEGNEIKVATAPGKDGKIAQGTGKTTEEAEKDAQSGTKLGEGYSPGSH